MGTQEIRWQQRELAARAALRDIRWLLDQGASNDEVAETLGGEQIIELLRRNFARLDPNNDGISRLEIIQALMRPTSFTTDEYVMLQLLCKYFDTVANMSDDEEGEETVITKTDGEVLAQFLLHSNLTLGQLHRWVAIASNLGTDKDMGLPPLAGH